MEQNVKRQDVVATNYQKARTGHLAQRRTLDVMMAIHVGLLVAFLAIGLSTECAQEIFLISAGFFAGTTVFMALRREEEPPDDPNTPLKEDPD